MMLTLTGGFVVVVVVVVVAKVVGYGCRRSLASHAIRGGMIANNRNTNECDTAIIWYSLPLFGKQSM